MKRRTLPAISAALLLALAGLLAACDDPTGPDEVLVVGTVDFYEEPVVIEVPDTVAAGEPFAVGVRTYGGGCERLGPTEVEALEDGVRVTPRDWTTVDPDVACTTELKLFEHEATLTWSTPGEITVRIRGREEPAGVERTFARTVVVRAP